MFDFPQEIEEYPDMISTTKQKVTTGLKQQQVTETYMK